jgi:hypothetical protein
LYLNQKFAKAHIRAF